VIRLLNLPDDSVVVTLLLTITFYKHLRFNQRLFSPKDIIDKEGFNKVLLDAWFSMEDESVSVWDAETLSLLYSNESGHRIFGYASGEELKRHHVFHCFSWENPTEVLSEKVNDALNKDGHWKDNVIFTRKDGTNFFGHVNLVKFSSGGKNYILKRVLDIQDKKIAEANLVQQNMKFEALFQYATMAIMVADKEGNIILSNKLASSLFEYSENEMKLLKVEDLIPMRFRENHVEHRNKFDAHPQNRTMGVGLDLFAKKKNGGEFPVEISLGHYKTDEGRFVMKNSNKKLRNAPGNLKKRLKYWNNHVMTLKRHLVKKRS
jgi:PAS domain S-box-containing protein